MHNPIQPRFSIHLYLDGKSLDNLKGSPIKGDGGVIDLAPFVSYPVELEIGADMMNRLNFTVDKYADVLLYCFHIGQRVVFYGGYYSDSSDTMRRLMDGTVTRIRTQFSDNGRVSFGVECMDYTYNKMGKDPHTYVYPDTGSKSRWFARKESLSVRDIVEGIAEENNYSVGRFELPPSGDFIERKSDTFTKRNILYQKNQSDWAFLLSLAESYACTVWVSLGDNGKEALNFVAKKTVSSETDDIVFFYPLNGTKDVSDNEVQRFGGYFDRPRILREVIVNEDVSSADSITRSSVYFDSSTGEYVSGIQDTVVEGGKRYRVYYELDENRVQEIYETQPDVANKILYGNFRELEWGKPPYDDPTKMGYYYRVVKKVDESVAVYDRAFRGIEVSAWCNQDLDITIQRTYRINGILSYFSKEPSERFYLRSLKHVWDSDGTKTELDFIR